MHDGHNHDLEEKRNTVNEYSIKKFSKTLSTSFTEAGVAVGRVPCACALLVVSLKLCRVWNFASRDAADGLFMGFLVDIAVNFFLQ
jgi:hypothetical protein